MIDENTQGNIRLEVIAEDTFFTPWESNFKVDASKKVTVEVKSKTNSQPIMEAKVSNITQETVTLTERDHVVNILKLLVKEQINIKNISYKKDKLNNIVATYLTEYKIDDSNKIIERIVKVLETKSKKWL